jgi:hypothetical protein
MAGEAWLETHFAHLVWRAAARAHAILLLVRFAPRPGIVGFQMASA